MKLSWRTHEMILVTIFTVFILVIYLLRLHFIPLAERNEIYGTPFFEHRESFNYYQNILLPQILLLALQYSCYRWLNLLIIPQVVSIVKRRGKKHKWILTCAGIVLQLAMVIYLLGPVSNFGFYYLSPFSTHPGILISFFPLHPQPLSNTFGGFNIAAAVVCIYLTYVAIREMVISFLERPHPLKNYRLMICNQVTTFTVVYISIYPFLHFLLVGNMQPGDMHSLPAIYFLVIPSILLVFLCNFYWLFPAKYITFPFKLTMLIPLVLLTFTGALPVLLIEQPWKYAPFLIIWATHLLIVTPLSWLIYQQRKDQVLQLRGVERKLAQSNADLQFLRSQINPHFLFNTLNTLYGTALREKSGDTARGIQQLGDMMRFMLHDNNQDFIDLEKEIAYLKNYISFQQLRIPDSPALSIEYNIGDSRIGIRVAPMLFIPFVENAFKYGISLKEKSWVRISLQCEDDHIHFEVHNSVHLVAAGDPGSKGWGIGLRNVKERLQWIYPDKHILTIQSTEHEFNVILKIGI